MEKIVFENNIVFLGYGSIARATIPLVKDHFVVTDKQIKILAMDVEKDRSHQEMTFCDIHFTKQNYKKILDTHITKGDLLVNLTAGISSLDLMQYCSEHEVLYLDTCIEMWPDEIDENSRTYDERELLLDLQKKLPSEGTTLLSSMGANPGVVSLLTKRLLLKIAKETGCVTDTPKNKKDWSELAKKLTVRVIHVNERDTQYNLKTYGPDDFVSTWSVEAMIVESIESAEMAIGSHEASLPEGAKYCGRKNKRDIYFKKPGKDVRIKTWLPLAGEQYGMILNHNEPYSIAELYASGDYAPTVCFVYHPSDQTMESLKYLTTENYSDKNPVILFHDIEGGRDELGVFIMTEEHGSFWLGSQLDIHTARSINPDSTATSLQVAGGVIGGMCWLVNHRHEGLVEPEDISDYNSVLDVAEPYWGYESGRTNWVPDTSKSGLQFEDFRYFD